MAIHAGAEAAAQLGSTKGVMKAWKQVHGRRLRRIEAQRLDIRYETRAADHNPLGKTKELIGMAPLTYPEKSVRPDNGKDFHRGPWDRDETGVGMGRRGVREGCLCEGVREGSAEPAQGVDGVVGFAGRPGAVDGRGLEAGVTVTKQLHHAEPIGERGLGATGFQWLTAGRGEQHTIQRKLPPRQFGNEQVGAMGRVKAAAEIA